MTERLRTQSRAPLKQQSLRLREIAPWEAEVVVLCLSDAPVWVATHWSDAEKRSFPCPAGCTCGRTLFRGFVHAIDRQFEEIVVVIGETAGQRANAWMDEHNTLRLSRWTMWRNGRDKNRPVRLWIEKPRSVTGKVPDDVDVAEFVRRLYGLPAEALRPPKKMAAGDEPRCEAAHHARLIG